MWDEDGNARRKVWWRRWRFRHVVLPFFLCACLNATAIIMLLTLPQVVCPAPILSPLSVCASNCNDQYEMTGLSRHG